RPRMRMLLRSQRPSSLSERASLEETDPAHRPKATARRPRSIARRGHPALARAQPAEAPSPHFQHLAVGPLERHVVLPYGQLKAAQRHAPLVDQPPRLRARDPELAGDQAGQMDDAVV